jgi:RES domain-containing protein
MRLWRLSIAPYAEVFDGGYGLRFAGRWNSVGRGPVTYAATSPSLCILEKLVHIEDPMLLPALTMVRYEAPADIAIAHRALNDLPREWRDHETLTQRIGDEWLDSIAAPVLLVPSVIASFEGSPDVNALINHRHADAARITPDAKFSFLFDPRLLST